jgi:hypothetical protein
MAKLMLIGEVAHVQLTFDPEDGQAIATCVLHDARKLNKPGWCTWTERYDTLDDAAEYAAGHADRG